MQFIARNLFNPKRFLKWSAMAIPLCAVAAFALFGWGLDLALWKSPPDYQQGETVRIMYVHVPAAWVGILIYVAMAVAAIITLVARIPIADIFCVAAAPVGTVLVGLCLVTGSIWGKPTWGAWWVWDARLTSVLILFLLYCGYMVLRRAFDEHEKGSKASAILLIIGAVNIPIVRFSVDWWHTLHQPASVLRMGGSTVAPEMLHPLLVMGSAYAFYAAATVMLRMRSVIGQRRIEDAMLRDGESHDR